ncbi:TPA: SWIM zinc finger family protein, partial [Escherichia coli]
MDVYIVTVSNDTGPLIMKCNCAAGEKGILCRHRKALITR